MGKYIMALDQGTTSSRAIIFNERSEIVATSQVEFEQLYPKPGWVEQNALTIYSSQYSVMNEVLAGANIRPDEIAAMGITNQRETTIIWDAQTGDPVYNAIIWQCRRTAEMAEELAEDAAFAEYVRVTTGLRIDAYFSATKIAWILAEIPDGFARAERGELLFGTVDTWLLWKLTSGAIHATDFTNASRTMLFNLETLTWDDTILARLNIPKAMLPEIYPSSYDYGVVNIGGHEIPITGIAGDQQAALFGQTCFSAGEMKNTYGTGCFLLLNTGNVRYTSEKGLLTTICASRSKESVQYALEGSVFVGGAAIQWLRDEMRFLEETADSGYFASKVADNGGVYFVPAFTGLAAPHWDMNARGSIFGLTRGTTRNHIIRAALEGIAYQVNDIIEAIEAETGIHIDSLQVDGGASQNAFLMQFQADISNTEIVQPSMLESTALGAAYLAGLHIGYWESEAVIKETKGVETVFHTKMPDEERRALLEGWSKAIGRSLAWLK